MRRSVRRGPKKAATLRAGPSGTQPPAPVGTSDCPSTAVPSCRGEAHRCQPRTTQWVGPWGGRPQRCLSDGPSD
eukprot:7970817-Pyramimonas_sp.AAC.1